ncbi:membrane protein [Arthrobacter phage BruhMoment]|nr:membrane protein [Arthrobacter phage BruhMoment]
MRHYAAPTRKNAALALASLAVIGAGLIVGVGASTPLSSHPAPAHTPIPATCTEDMECWDPARCAEIGNRICGTAGDAATAWLVWEQQEGERKLKVDPSRPYRVDYMASTPDYPQNMDAYDLALVGKDGRWYVFRATYLDSPA